jgi:hypothetical protein
VKTIVADAPAQATLKLASRHASTSGTKLLDDRASEALNALGDRLADSIGDLERAIEVINAASYSDRRWDDRARARLLLSLVLTAVAQVNVELARPLPSFRAGSTGPRLFVSRPRADVDVADFQAVPMPVRVMGVVR